MWPNFHVQIWISWVFAWSCCQAVARAYCPPLQQDSQVQALPEGVCIQIFAGECSAAVGEAHGQQLPSPYMPCLQAKSGSYFWPRPEVAGECKTAAGNLLQDHNHVSWYKERACRSDTAPWFCSISSWHAGSWCLCVTWHQQSEVLWMWSKSSDSGTAGQRWEDDLHHSSGPSLAADLESSLSHCFHQPWVGLAWFFWRFFLRFSCFVSLASLPRRKHGYQTAWVPPNCGMVGSGREECCIFEACRAQVQRRVAGWDSENNEQQLLQTTKRNTPAKWKRMQIRYGSKPLAEASSERVVCNFGTKAACFLRWSYWSVQFPQEVFSASTNYNQDFCLPATCLSSIVGFELCIQKQVFYISNRNKDHQKVLGWCNSWWPEVGLKQNSRHHEKGVRKVVVLL